MKKLMIIATLIVASVASFAYNNNTQINNLEPKQTTLINLDQYQNNNSANYLLFSESENRDIIINIYIKWGRKKYDCLSGFGICIFYEWSIHAEGSGVIGKGDVITKAKLKKDGNRYFIILNKSDIEKYEILRDNLLGSNNVVFEERFEIPESILQNFGERGSKTVKPGTYRLTSDRETVTIHL
ncbi:MAG: hypothetical protein ACOX4D_01600 [Bacteroidales bacterium]|jgi:hypothetical protein